MTEFSEQLEEQLSVLWDMTVEEDVSLFLLNNNFLDLATTTIMQTENERLIVSFFSPHDTVSLFTTIFNLIYLCFVYPSLGNVGWNYRKHVLC